ncbi:hypothetical protein CPC08DRAFT_765027 [Agrocybe pediades]|nr:hypothetical protein CPC08DRAFT_765027 [Agrocybe pediades]
MSSINNGTPFDPNAANHRVSLPSEQVPVEPYKVDTLPQQGSTQPGDGKEVHTDGQFTADSNAATGQHQKVPFKEQVIGVAQKTRGTLLNKPELKEHGEQILEGVTTHEQDRHH